MNKITLYVSWIAICLRHQENLLFISYTNKLNLNLKVSNSILMVNQTDIAANLWLFRYNNQYVVVEGSWRFKTETTLNHYSFCVIILKNMINMLLKFLFTTCCSCALCLFSTSSSCLIVFLVM